MKKSMRPARHVLFPAVFVMITACAGVQEAGGPESFTTYNREASIPGESGRSSAALSFQLTEVSRPKSLQHLVRAILYEGQSAEAYQRKMTEAWQRDYRKALAEHGDYAAAWSYEEAHHFIARGRFAVIYKNVSWYQGGAHPEWYEQSYLLDLDTSELLELKDLVTEEGRAAIDLASDRELRRLSTVMGRPLSARAPLSQGIYFDDRIPLSKDFAPAENGLNFQWDPYEIAPYSFGALEITVRWKELEGMLTPLGREMEEAFRK